MNSDVRVSIITVVNDRNHAAFAACLPSYRAQDYPGRELIIVDNGCREPLTQDTIGGPAAIVRMAHDTGAAHARNRGADRAQGEYLLFVDSDVQLPPDALTRLCREREQSGAAAVVACHRGDSYYANFASAFKHHYLSYFHAQVPRRIDFIDASCVLISAAAFAAVAGYRELPTLEDYDLGLRLTKAGYAIIMTRATRIVHMKRYGLWQLLLTDVYRSYIKMRLIVTYSLWLESVNSQKQILREYLVGVPVSLALAVLLALGMAGWPLAVVLLAAFYLGNSRYLAYFHSRTRGRYVLRCELFLLVSMALVGISSLAGVVVTVVRGRL